MKSTSICINTELPIGVADERFQTWPFSGRTCECGDHDPMPISEDFGYAAEGIDLDSEEAAITTVPQLVGAFEVLCDHIAQQPALTPDVLDTIRVSLIQTSTVFTGYLDDPNGDYFAGELWHIDRARRALGLED